MPKILLKIAICTRSPQEESAPVTYRLKVLSSPGKGRTRPTRTILFQRIAGDESIEISAKTDASNLLAELPELLDAALAIRSALQPGERPSDESQRMRLLASERGAKRRARARERDALIAEARAMLATVWEALGPMLEPARRAALEVLVRGENAMTLSTSLVAIAAELERVLDDSGEAIALGIAGVDADHAAALRKLAANVRAMEVVKTRATHDRGRSSSDLRLVGMTYRATPPPAHAAG